MRRGSMKKRAAALLCALLMTAALLPGQTVYGLLPPGADTTTPAVDTTTPSTDTTPAADTKSDEEQKKADEEKKNADAAAIREEYENLQKEISGKREEMDNLKQELEKIKGQKANTQQQKSLLDQRNSALTEEINLLEQQIDVTTRSIAANAETEKRQTELFHKQIRMEEEQGTISYWSVLFKASSFSDLVSRIDFINEIMNYNSAVIDKLREVRNELAADRVALQKQNDELAASKKELEGQISESMKMLAEYTKTQEGKLAEYDAVKAEEEALDALIAAAEAKARELGVEEVAGTTGGYIWPCSVRWITSRFGGRQSPGGIGSTNHKGVDIGAPMGTAVVAAKSGVVTWASRNGGYGKCVIVSHGKGNSTLYGHLSSYTVSVGDQVSQGQVIAYSGNTGNSTGPHLHFGIKEGDSWVDPLNYLGGGQYIG